MCLDCNCGQPVKASPAPPRRLELGQRLLVHNDAQAAANRKHFASEGARVINLLSSPGSGKTALLERIARELVPPEPVERHPMAVMVGTGHRQRRPPSPRRRSAGRSDHHRPDLSPGGGDGSPGRR